MFESAFYGPWWLIVCAIAYGVALGVFVLFQYPRLLRLIREGREEAQPPK